MGNGWFLTSFTRGRGGRIEVRLPSFDDECYNEGTLGILVLNFYLLIPFMTSAVNGFDSSLINGIVHLVIILLFYWNDTGNLQVSKSPLTGGTISIIRMERRWVSILFFPCPDLPWLTLQTTCRSSQFCSLSWQHFRSALHSFRLWHLWPKDSSILRKCYHVHWGCTPGCFLECTDVHWSPFL